MMKNKKISLPPIGLRIIKSAVAVFLCYIVNLLRGGSGIVFYSQLSALWCMQDYISETKGKAQQRTVGTIIGAIFGLFVLLLFGYVPISEDLYSFVNAAVISLSVVFIIYTTVVLNKRDASYFSCVVFLSIVVNHLGDINPYLFVWNRVLDTMIGILIGVCVNCFALPHKRNKHILFLSGLDDTLLNSKNNMSGYSRVELNRMIEEGLCFSISTIRTPASLMEVMKDIKLKLPVIVMDGAALYNLSDNRFEKVYVISEKESGKVADFLDNEGVSYFANVVIEDTLLIYYQDSESEIYNEIVSSLRKSPYRNYINRPVPKDESVVYYMVIDKKENINRVFENLCSQGFNKVLKIVMYEYEKDEEYAYIKIYNHNACKENMIDYLRYMTNTEKTVTFGTVAGKYTHLITPGDTNRVVKMIKKEFGAWN